MRALPPAPPPPGQSAKRVPHYLWVGLLLLGLLWALHSVSMPAGLENAVTLREAQASLPQHPQQPPQQVSLPHILDDQPAAWSGWVDYRLDWPAALHYDDPAQTRLALLLPRVGTRFRVLLNGHEIYQVGWYAAPERNILSAWFPYLVSLPPGLLQPQPQQNQIHIQVQGRLLERSGLWPLQIGYHGSLFERHQVLEVWQVKGTWMMLISSLLMGLLSLHLWRTLNERLFLLMAVAALAHSVRLALSVSLEPPLSFGWYFYLHRLAFTWYVGFFLLFVAELLAFRDRLVHGLAWFLIGVGPFWLAWTLHTQDYDLYRIWAGAMAVCGALSLLSLLFRSLQRGALESDQILVLLVASFTLATGVRDFLVVQLNFPGDADLRWTSLGSLALLFTLSWVLAQRATASTREVHRLNQSLAGILAKREAELRQAFDQLRASEQQRAIEGERRRLMRDMHDGLGSQLVQTLNMVRSQKHTLDAGSVESMIHHALEELRLMLDSLEPMEGDLATILGTFRQRIEPALVAAGIELDWQVQDVPALSSLDAQGVMHLFRCMQEIFANVVKHAQARRVCVRTRSDAAHVYLTVTDDGLGMQRPHTKPQAQRGLGNLRARAGKLGAQVRFFDAHPGTGIEFAFPIHRTFTPEAGDTVPSVE